MAIQSYSEYMDEISGFYNVHQENFMKNLEPINKFQKSFDFVEFNNIMITCLNATTLASKYLKQHGFNVYDKSASNKDRAIAVTLERYFLVCYLEALDEFYKYVSETNDISDNLSEKLGYKFFLKIPSNIYTIGYKNRYVDYIRNLYKDSQIHVSNFKDITNKVYNFNIEENFSDAITSYIPFIFDELTKRSIYGDKIKDLYFNLSIYQLQINRINESLKKLGLDHYIPYIKELSNQILADKLKEKPELYMKTKSKV